MNLKQYRPLLETYQDAITELRILANDGIFDLDNYNYLLSYVVRGRVKYTSVVSVDLTDFNVFVFNGTLIVRALDIVDFQKVMNINGEFASLADEELRKAVFY